MHHPRSPARRPAGAVVGGAGNGAASLPCTRRWTIAAAVIVAAVTMLLVSTTQAAGAHSPAASSDATHTGGRVARVAPATTTSGTTAAPLPPPTSLPAPAAEETLGPSSDDLLATAQPPPSDPVPAATDVDAGCPAPRLLSTERIVPRRLPIAPLLAAWMGHEHDRREWTVVDGGAGLGYFTSAVVEAAFGPASDFAAAFGRRALGMAAVEYGAIEVARAPCERLNTMGGLGCDANVVFQPDDLARQLYQHGPGQVNAAAAAANWTVIQIEGGSRNAEFLKNFFSSSSDPLAAAAPHAIARHRHAATIAAEAAAASGDAAAVGNVAEERPPDAELGSVAEPMPVDHDGSAAVKALEAAAKAKIAALQRTVSPLSPAGRGRALVAAADSRLRFLQRHAAIVPQDSGSLHFPEHCAFGDVDGCRAVSSSQADLKAFSTVDRDGKLHIHQPTPAMPIDALLPRRFRQPSSTGQAAMVDVLSLDLSGLGLAVATHSKLIGRGQVRLLVVDVGPTTTAEYARMTAVATGPGEGQRSRRDRVAAAEASVRYGGMVRDGLEFLHRHGYACFAAVESAGIERQCSAGGGSGGGTEHHEQQQLHQVAGQEDEALALRHGGEHGHGRSFVPLNPVASCWNAERYGNELRGARVLCAARTEKALLAELHHNSEPSPAPVMASHERGGPTCCRHPAEGFRHLAASVLAGTQQKHSATSTSASALATSTAYPSSAWLWATEAFRGPDECPATHAAYPSH